MANKQRKQPQAKRVTENKATLQKSPEIKKGAAFHLFDTAIGGNKSYLPGILLFFVSVIIGILTYKDYGMSWDEPAQREIGTVSYNYVFSGDKTLLSYFNRFYGAGFELPLICIEKMFGLTDLRDVFLMRHLVTHIFFLVSALCGYFLVLRLFKNNFLACVGFIMLVLCPRIYAHSFFNSKDVIFMSMVTITLWIAQIAFDKNKTGLYLLLGAACGYATSIRIMGIMLFLFISLFLLVDLVISFTNKEKMKKTAINLLVVIAGFCCMLYISWPYLWESPIRGIINSFTKMSQYSWVGNVLVSGRYDLSTKQPWSYFPTWFFISNPILWLVCGFSGLLWIAVDFFKKPLNFLQNTPGRNFLLYFLCFTAPIFAVICLHSVIYDDWRHLFFVYPSFVLASLYFINKMLQSKFKLAVQAACIIQIGFTGFFMIANHPFQQVYFNSLVSHKPEFLRKNYEMDYWAVSFKQGLDHILETDKSPTIKINSNYYDPLRNNILMLDEADRSRIKTVNEAQADYLFTNFRDHPNDYPPYKNEYSIKVLNSTIFSILKLEKDPAKLKQIREEAIANLKKSLTTNPDNFFEQTEIGLLYSLTFNYDFAEQHLKQAYLLSPANIRSISNLASLYFAEKKYDDAIGCYKKNLELDRDHVSSYTDIAACYGSMGKNDSAIYFAKRAVSVDSNFKMSYQILAATYSAVNIPDSARKYGGIAEKK